MNINVTPKVTRYVFSLKDNLKKLLKSNNFE